MADLPVPNSRNTRFGRALLIAVILGGLARAVETYASGHVPKSFELVPGIVAWVGAMALCTLLAMFLSRAQDLWRTLAAMWRPLVLVLLAAFVLFFNDQGRELGVSLMIDDDGWHRFVFLFFALIYWSLNNWHTSRLGLHAALEAGTIGILPEHRFEENPNRHVVAGNERWLFWLPRLIGVCAHLFAAIALSLAAWRQPDFGGDRLRLLAWTAPFAIVIFTALVYTFDRLSLSRRTQKSGSAPVRSAALVAAFVLLGAIAIIACSVVWMPLGFRWGTFAISLSAFAFLMLVSLLRRRAPLGAQATEDERRTDDLKETKSFRRWTVWLFAFAVGLAICVCFKPEFFGRFLGSMVVAYFALGAVLAAVNFFEFALAGVIKRQWLGVTTTPRAFGACAVAGVIAFCVVNAWLHPFHRVRLCDGYDCVAPTSVPASTFVKSPDDRPSVDKAANVWYEQAKAAYLRSHGGRMPVRDELPMLIVATAGGGIRAAYWTAAVLEKIENDLGPEGGMRPYLFAISGVSGGSVGATAFEAALTARDEKQCAAGADGCPSATSFLTEDFLAPVLASWIFRDTLASFLPDLGLNDRGAALEKGFEHASNGLLARPFLSLFPFSNDPGPPAPGQPAWRPVLLLNATHEETGKRIITGHVLIERNVFIDSLDALDVLSSDVRASTAAHNSARFTYISPAGNLGKNNGKDNRNDKGKDNGSVIDGGYFENYGALSALEVARAAEAALKNKELHVKLVILMISSDPDLDNHHALVRIDEPKDGGQCLVSTTEPDAPPGNPGLSQDSPPPKNYLRVEPEEVSNAWLNEFAAPLQGINNVREAHGNRAAAELAVKVCAEYPEPPELHPRALGALRLSQTPLADTANRGKSANRNSSGPARARPDEPYFAHLAMCRSDAQGGVNVDPPLGWVLSKATRGGLDGLLSRCGNDRQREELEAALEQPAEPLAAEPSDSRLAGSN